MVTSILADDKWTQESFEDQITRATIALYESTIDKRTLKNIASRRLTPEHLALIRRQGVFIPARDREFWNPHNKEGKLEELIKPYPSGCVSMGEDKDIDNPDRMESYCRIEYFRRVPQLPRSVLAPIVGQPYEVISLFPQERGALEGIRRYAIFNSQTGQIRRCVDSNPGLRVVVDELRTEEMLNFGLQVADDIQHQWRITALQASTRVTVGAYAENVKSLLYARTLPMTPTGRKRPILHVVGAHRRRLKAGTDIDIKSFLRGTREIEMDGTLFRVEAPEKLIQELLEQ